MGSRLGEKTTGARYFGKVWPRHTHGRLDPRQLSLLRACFAKIPLLPAEKRCVGMARTVSATLVVVVMCYTAIPPIVSAMADNSKLQHQLQLQSVELAEARAEINQLRYRAMQPGMLTEDDAPREAQQGHRPPLVGTAPLPDAITAAAAAFTNPQCREEWLARRRRDAAPSALPSAHPEPLPFAGGSLEAPLDPSARSPGAQAMLSPTARGVKAAKPQAR